MGGMRGSFGSNTKRYSKIARRRTFTSSENVATATLRAENPGHCDDFAFFGVNFNGAAESFPRCQATLGRGVGLPSVQRPLGAGGLTYTNTIGILENF